MKKWIIYTLFAINLMAVVLLALWTYGWIGDHEKEEIQSRGTPPQVVDIGSGPNTGTGDPLRTAFNKININFSAVYDSLEKWTGLIGPGGSMTWPALAGIPLYAGSQSWGTSITDNSANWNTAYGWGDHSLANYLTSGDIAGKLNISDTASMLTNYALKSELGDLDEQAVTEIVEGVLDDAIQDAVIGVAVEDVLGGTTGRDRYMSPAQIESYVALHGGGGGSFSGGERIKFTVGDPGAPAADDSTFFHSALADKQIDLFRDGVKSEYTYASGSITVDPDWQTAENVEILLWPWGTWEYLDLETSIEAGLINSLVGYWKFDEGEEATAAEAYGNTEYDLTLNYRLWSSGMFSSSGVEPRLWETAVARDDGLGDLNPKGPFSLSMWFYLDSLPSEMAEPRSMYLYTSIHSDPHFDPINLRIGHEAPYQNYIEFNVRNTIGGWYTVRSSEAVTKNTCHHIMVSFPGINDHMKIYLDGEDVSATDVTFLGSLYEADSFFNLGSQERYSKSYLRGYFDDVILLDRATTEAEAAWIWNGGTGRQLTTP